jgi:YHS domain-containing protein
MGRVLLLVFLVLAVLLLFRLLRVLASRMGRPPGPDRHPGALEGEMVRDPVCGTWIDRRLALAARSSGEWIPVCSEKCKLRAEGS